MFDALKRKLSEFSQRLKSSVSVKPAEGSTSSKLVAPEQSSPPTAIASKPAFEVKVKATTQLKHVLKLHLQLTEPELENVLFDLELALLEADVTSETAQALCTSLKEDLLTQEIPKNQNASEFVSTRIRAVLQFMLSVPSPNLVELIHGKKTGPFVILLLGPNGAGKTTTLAKLTHYFQLQKISILWSASDTFRAASIEQLEEHARRLNVRVIKQAYGADPAAVAFDAIQSARANNIQVVLIDSAGRQETNRNLMEELKKLVRVTQPDLKIFVGEALAGKSLLEQVRVYHQALSLDGFILTKLDADPKGGTAISLIHSIQKPILFVGTGQEYKDLQEFSPEFILNRIF